MLDVKVNGELQLLEVFLSVDIIQCGIVHIDDKVGLCSSVDSPLYSHGFQRVIALTQTCGVDYPKRDALYDKCLFNCIACGAGDVADNGTAVVEQCVEEG